MSLLKPELELFGVYDAGVANQERIALRVNWRVDLREYALVVGFKGLANSIFPVPDFFLWLGGVTIEAPGWVIVYTGRGQPTISLESHTKEPMHVLYWNRPNLLFGDPQVVPALVRFADVQVFRANQNFQELLEKKKAARPQVEFDIDAFLRSLTDQTKK